MKNVKRVLLITGVVGSALLTSAAFAKPPCGKGPNLERLAAELELTEEQSAEFIAIMESQHEKRDAMREEKMEAVREEMEQHRQETLSALSSVLTEEQLAEMEQFMERGKGHHHKGMHHKRED